MLFRSHIIFAGALSGLAGAYICCVTLPAWQNDIVAGKGWIAVALVIFASWNPCKAFLGALLFGLLSILGIRLQKYNLPISQYIFDMIPYLMTILVLFIGALSKTNKHAKPAALGEAYFRESR